MLGHRIQNFHHTYDSYHYLIFNLMHGLNFYFEIYVVDASAEKNCTRSLHQLAADGLLQNECLTVSRNANKIGLYFE